MNHSLKITFTFGGEYNDALEMTGPVTIDVMTADGLGCGLIALDEVGQLFNLRAAIDTTIKAYNIQPIPNSNNEYNND